jgi:plasmid stabilization system protein ParE
MAYKIVWSQLAIETYISNIEFLEVNWTEREIIRFINVVKRRLLLLSSNPFLATVTNKRKNVRKTVIQRRVVLFYRVKPGKKEIELIRFWSTRQNPGKLKR